MKSVFVLQGFCGECGVCYAYQLDGLVPDMVCENLQCNQPFHFACLLEVSVYVHFSIQPFMSVAFRHL